MHASVQAALDQARRDHPLERPSASSQVYDDLRQRILSLDLPPGTPLLRAELATRYSVSQTPIRDAMQRLAQDGLVRIFPQSRTLVTRIDIPQIYEAHFLRTALETEVVRQLAEDPVAETISRARSVVAMQQQVASDRSQITVFQELDEYFHRVLFEGVGRGALHRLVMSRSGHLDRVRRLQPPSDEKIRRIIAGHDAILDGVAAGDTSAAVAAIRDHLSKTVSRVAEFRAQHEEYFA